VLPGAAEATVNIRLLPGATPRPAIRELERVIGDRKVKVTPISPKGESADETLARFEKRAKQPPSSIDTELYRALAREGKREWPTARVAPALFEAGTDAVPWRERGVPVYGIYPYPISRAELADMHGNDEHISIRRLEEGTDMLTRVIRAAATG